jgi:catechol 2,3-dioxygenase-like lactoylglutathione lyase family enzyme
MKTGPTTNLDRSIDFYQRIMGLELLTAARPAPHVAIFDLGNVHLLLHADCASAVAPDNASRGCGVLIHLHSENMDMMAEHLDACGYPISFRPVTQSFGQRQMHLYDPDRHNIVIVTTGM